MWSQSQSGDLYTLRIDCFEALKASDIIAELTGPQTLRVASSKGYDETFELPAAAEADSITAKFSRKKSRLKISVRLLSFPEEEVHEPEQQKGKGAEKDSRMATARVTTTGSKPLSQKGPEEQAQAPFNSSGTASTATTTCSKSLAQSEAEEQAQAPFNSSGTASTATTTGSKSLAQSKAEQNKSTRPASNNLKPCEVCIAPAKSSCSICKTVRYCSTKCQRADYKQHKKICPILANVRVELHPEKGRILVAKKSFSPGEVVFSDQALLLVDFTRYGRERRLLEKVTEQLVAEGYTDLDEHVFLPALQYARENARTRSQLLRMCYPGADLDAHLKRSVERGVELMVALELLQSDTGATGATGATTATDRDSGAGASASASVSVSEYTKLCLICMTNQFGVRASLHAMHFYGALSSHACLPNCDWRHRAVASGQHVFEERAIVHIQAGAEITHAYFLDERWRPRRMRRAHMQETKFFICQCERCTSRDLSEGFACPACNQGTVFLQEQGETRGGGAVQTCDNPGCVCSAQQDDPNAKAHWREVVDKMRHMNGWAEEEIPNLKDMHSQGQLLEAKGLKRLLAVYSLCAQSMSQHWCLAVLDRLLYDILCIQSEYDLAARHIHAAVSIMEHIYERPTSTLTQYHCRLGDTIASSLGLDPSNFLEAEMVEYGRQIKSGALKAPMSKAQLRELRKSNSKRVGFFAGHYSKEKAAHAFDTSAEMYGLLYGSTGDSAAERIRKIMTKKAALAC